MKKLYNPNKGAKRVHPSPPPPPHLSALPTALLALASALSAEEQEVLAYLLGCCCSPSDHKNSRSGKQRKERRNNNNNKSHPPELGCSCFGCYKSFWARWDSSPNRHVIHAIIDAFEDTLDPNKEPLTADSSRSRGNKKNPKQQHKRGAEAPTSQKIDQVVDSERAHHAHHHDDDDGYDSHDDDEEEEGVEEEEGKSSVRRFVSWVFGISAN